MQRFTILVAIACLFGIFSPKASGQTVQLEWSAQPYNINSIFFLLQNTALGWACGDYGTILASTDGGDTWVAQKTGTTADFQSITFADDKNGIAVGKQGLMYGTTDGGKVWKERTKSTIRNLNFVQYAPGQNRLAWAVGQTGTILTTTDGGSSWFPQDSPSTAELTCISMISATTGAASGKGGTVIRTTNGGTSWIVGVSGTAFDLGGIHLLSAQAGWIAGDSGFVAKTTNSGATWTRQPTGFATKLTGINFSGPSIGWAIGKGGMILKTLTGGNEWMSVNDDSRAVGLDTSDLTCVFAGGGSSTHKAWTSGKSGLILATRDGGFTWIRLAEKPRGTLFSIHFSPSGMNGWAVGTFGSIYATSSGGRIWQKQVSNTTVNLNGVQFRNDRNGIVVGDAGVVLTTANGGTTWTPSNSQVSDHLRSLTLSQINGTSGWAAGVNGATIITADGGGNWSKGSNPHFTALNGIHFAETALGCAVGALGEVLTSYNGGTTWQPQFSGTTQELKSVYLTSWTTGWAVGANSTMLQTINSGQAWTSKGFLSPPRSLNSVRFPDALNGWIAGDNGTILNSSDAGATWKQITGITQNNIFTVSFPTVRIGWFAGQNAEILHVENHTDYLLAPANGQTDIDTRPKFQWYKHAGSNGYKVMYSKTENAFADGGAIAATTVLTNTENDTTAFPDVRLDAETTYYWTVEERTTGFRLGFRSFRTSTGPVRLRASIADVSVCAGSDTLLSVIPSSGKAPFTYSWRQSNGSPIPPDEIIAQTDATLRLKPEEPRTLTCTVTDARGETDTAVINVRVVIVQPVIAKAPEFLCSGSSVRLSVVGKYASYSWRLNQNPVGTDSVFIATAGGKYSVAVRNANGCEGISEEVELLVQPLPTPTIDGSDAICINQKNVPYRVATFLPKHSYHWSIDSGAVRATITSGGDLSTATLDFGAAGRVVLRLRETNDSTKCYAETTFALTVGEGGFKPTVTSKSGKFLLCDGVTDTLYAPSGFSKYQWRNNKQDITGATSQNLAVSAAGSYSVFVVDAGGCKGESDQITIKTGVSPKPEITGLAEVCAGNKGIIYRIPSPQTGSTILWNLSGNGQISGAADGASVTINFGGKGAASLHVTETSPDGCSGESTFPIVIGDSLRPTIAGVLRFCTGQSTVLDAGAGDSYKWYFNTAELPSETQRTLIVKKAGTYAVAIAQGACSGTSDAVSVTETPRPDSVIFEDVRSGLLTAPTAASWQWYTGAPPDTVRLIGKTTQTFQPDAAGTYSVAAVNSSGCTTLIVIRAGGLVNLGTFGIQNLTSADSIVTVAPAGVALLELRSLLLDSAKAAGLGIAQYRLRVEWDSRQLNGVFPTNAPTSEGDVRRWEFVVQAASAPSYLQRLSFEALGATGSQASVTLSAQAEDGSGISPRGRVKTQSAIVKVQGDPQPPTDTTTFDISTIIPNPSDAAAVVNIHGKPGEVLEFSLTDTKGKRLLLISQVQINSAGTASLNIPTADYAIGQYFASVRRGSEIKTTPLQVVR